jgi:GT2 family glycosyltransferase
MTEEYGSAELTNYQYMMGETLQVIKKKNNGLTDSFTPFSRFLNRLSSRLTKLNKSKRIADKKSKEIKTMQNSNSWKITKPLRKATSLFKGKDNKKKSDNLKDDYFVSIIMPVNHDEMISDSIDSALNQTFDHFELIVIDDGTEEFIKENYSDFDKIRYFKTDYESLSHARNYGLEKSEGNIVAYLDSDARWDPKFLEVMLKKLKKSDCAYCGIMDNKTSDTLNIKFNRKKLLKENFINLNSFIHKKELYDEYGGFDENLKALEDWDLIIRYTKENTPAHVKDILVNGYKTIPDAQDIDVIHERYWMELYNKEYNIIKNDFDENFYVSEYGEEFSDILTPIHHFLSRGYKEGKNPNNEFDTFYYRNQHEKLLKNREINPFVYYIQNGRKEGHKTNYYDEKDNILNTNLTLLSNYEFDSEPLVSIIILNKDGLNHLKRLFKNFSDNTNYSNFEIIVVDNASEDDSVDYLKSLDLDINIIENKENVSFAKGNNDASKIANGEYILLLNNDIEPTYGWLNEMMGTIIYNDNVASVGAKLIYPFIDDPLNTNKSFSIQHAGDILRETIDDICLYKGHNQNKFSKDIFDSAISVNKKRLLVTAAVLLVKKSVYDELGGLDESYWYGYEDIDFNLRVNRAGYDTIFASSALLFHHESATRKTINRNNHKVFCQKWSKYLFKKLLRDKIERNYFFTDKKLDILLVGDSDFAKYEDSVHDFVDYCMKNSYNVNVDLNKNNLNIDDKTDIIISFTENYDIKSINARENIIKIMVNSDDDLNRDNLDYDIFIKDADNLSEVIFPELYHRYLDS